MEHELIVKDEKYKVDADNISNEIMTPVAAMFENFLTMQEQYEMLSADYQLQKNRLFQVCEKLNQEIGFKSLKGEYGTITYVPEKEESIELVDDYDVVQMLSDLASYGEDISKYIIKTEKKVNGRKAYIKTK